MDSVGASGGGGPKVRWKHRASHKKMRTAQASWKYHLFISPSIRSDLEEMEYGVWCKVLNNSLSVEPVMLEHWIQDLGSSRARQGFMNLDYHFIISNQRAHRSYLSRTRGEARG